MQTLYDLNNPFDFNDNVKALFFIEMKKTFKNHYENCAYFNNLCKISNFSLDNLKTFDDIYTIPHIFVNTFKERSIISISDDKIKLTLTSSGTSGQKSQIVLDKLSLNRILTIVEKIYDFLGMVDKTQKTNYICFTYDPKKAKNLGTAFSDKVLTSFAKINKIYYTIQYDNQKKDFYLDENKVKEKIIKYSKEPYPIRILGFPAFIYKIVTTLHKETGLTFNFGPKSFILTGGGWKGEADKEISKLQFKTEISQILGIPPENIRDMFGMVEHGIPYVECKNGNMHVPIYSRVIIRHPLTLQNLGYDNPGILHLYTPYINSVPSISLLCTDKAILRKNCNCGIDGDYIELLGRGGITKHKGCAIQAAELFLNKQNK